jgi:hypothetical protein
MPEQMCKSNCFMVVYNKHGLYETNSFLISILLLSHFFKVWEMFILLCTLNFKLFWIHLLWKPSKCCCHCVFVWKLLFCCVFIYLVVIVIIYVFTVCFLAFLAFCLFSFFLTAQTISVLHTFLPKGVYMYTKAVESSKQCDSKQELLNFKAPSFVQVYCKTDLNKTSTLCICH